MLIVSYQPADTTLHTLDFVTLDLQFLALATEFFSGVDLGSLCREVSNLLSDVATSR